MIRHDILPTLLLMLSVLLPYRGLAQGVMSLDGEIATCGIDSYKEMKYGQVSPDLHTGSVNVSIPFYTYQDPDFEIPISFGYTSSGHQPNSKAGVMGPDWRLEGGHSITVDIRGIEDYGADKDGNPGFFRSHFQDYSSFTNPQLWRLCQPGVHIASSGAFSPYLMVVPGGVFRQSTRNFDAQSDIYHFSMPGHRGTFHLGWNGKVFIYDTGENNSGFSVDIGQDSGYSTITITTSDGYAYSYGAPFDLTWGTDDGSMRKTAWHLQRITAPNGRQVRYSYTEYDSSDCSPSGYDVTGTIFSFTGNDGFQPGETFSLEHRVNEVRKTCRVPSSITIDGGPTINFTYRTFSADSCDAFSNDDSSLNPYYRTSTRLTGVRVSYAGKTLREASLNYAPYAGGGKRLYFLESVDIKGEGRYSMEYYGNEYLPGNGTFSIDHWGYFNGKNNTHNNDFLKVTVRDSLQNETVVSRNRDPNASFAICGMLRKLSYPTGGYTVFSYGKNTYSHIWRRLSNNTYDNAAYSESGVCGGLRIERVSHFTADGSPATTCRYEYTSSRSDTTSTGILLNFPRYSFGYSARLMSQYPSFENNITYRSANINNYGGSHIEYSSVREIYPDSSCVEYLFSNSLTSPAYADYVAAPRSSPEKSYNENHKWEVISNLPTTVVAPCVSLNAERGKLLSKRQFRNADEADPLFEEGSGFLAYKNMLPKDTIPVYLIRRTGSTEVLVDNYRQNRSFRTEHCLDGEGNSTSTISDTTKIFYNCFGQADSTVSSGSDGRITATRKIFSTDSSSLGPVYMLFKEKHILDATVCELSYDIDPSSGNGTLSSGTRYEYGAFASVPVPKPTSKWTYDAQGKVWKKETQYVEYNAYGNLVWSEDANGIPTSYVWGYGGVYLIAVLRGVTGTEVSGVLGGCTIDGGLTDMQYAALKNSFPHVEITRVDYSPFVGPSLLLRPDGTRSSIGYNPSGKPSIERDADGNKTAKALYSTDNKTADNRQ